jgi:hypothetical protein
MILGHGKPKTLKTMLKNVAGNSMQVWVTHHEIGGTLAKKRSATGLLTGLPGGFPIRE